MHGHDHASHVCYGGGRIAVGADLTGTYSVFYNGWNNPSYQITVTVTASDGYEVRLKATDTDFAGEAVTVYMTNPLPTLPGQRLDERLPRFPVRAE